MANTLYSGNDHLVEIAELQDVAGAAYINDATVNVTVKDKAGATIAGPIAMPYVTASDGTYRGTLPDTMSVTLGAAYIAEITADGGAGLLGFWRFPFTARERIT